MKKKALAVKKELGLSKVENSPAEMIRMAVAGNADLEKLEKLLSLQERYEANEAKKAYHVAMATFKANPPKIDKDKKVRKAHENKPVMEALDWLEEQSHRIEHNVLHTTYKKR